MADIEEFVKVYYRSLKDIIEVLPDTSNLLPCIEDTSIIIGFTDKRGKLAIQLFSRKKNKEIVINGNIIKPISKKTPRIVHVKDVDNLERIIFPQNNDDFVVSMSLGDNHIVLSGLAFSSKDFNDKYWKDVKFYRNCAGNIPFTVTGKGAVLALDILYGVEIDGKRNEILYEYLKVFGSEEALPKTKKEIFNSVFQDFYHTIQGDDKKTGSWSFTDFIAELEAPVQKNVLLLGSYASNDDFEKMRTLLLKFGYNGFLLKDSPDLPIQSNLEKLLAAIICSSFVIVFDDEASGHIAELGNMLQFRFRPVIIIRKENRPSTTFIEDQILTDENFKVIIEPNISQLDVLQFIKWARNKLSNKKENYNKINYWRNK